MNQETQVASAEKGKETDSFPEPAEGAQPANILIPAQQNPFWTSDLRNYTTVHLCCFMLLSLRSFVIAVIGN